MTIILKICVYLCNTWVLLSQQSQFVFHHQVWLTHHLTLGWICKTTEQTVNHLEIMFRQFVLMAVLGEGRGSWPLRMSSKPMASSLPRSVSRARFELCMNGRRWIWRSRNGYEMLETERDSKMKQTLKYKRRGLKGKHWLGRGFKFKRHTVTCLAALYSICSLRGAWSPWMFLSVDKLILSLLAWNCTQQTHPDNMVIKHCLVLNIQSKQNICSSVQGCRSSEFGVLLPLRLLTFFSISSSGWLGMSSFFTLEKLYSGRGNATGKLK